MGMKALEDLREMLCRELEEIAQKQEMSAGDLETVHKLTDTVKNIDKIEMLEEESGYSHDGYSGDGNWMAKGGYSRDGYSGGRYSMDDDYSGRRGTHYVRGHYSHDGYSGRRMYSGADDAKQRIVEQIQQMMNDGSVNAQDKAALRKAMEQLER